MEGQSLLVGRGTSCDIVLDDELASREHLRLTLSDGALVAEDLGSRNGVLVNGLPVRGSQELHHGDHVTAGRTPLTVVQQVHEPRARSQLAGTPDRQTSWDDVTATGSLPALLGGSARTALGVGDLTSAETSARNLLVALRGMLARGGVVEPAVLDDAVDLAIELAAASQEPVWIERLLDLCVTAARPIDARRAARVAELGARLAPSASGLAAYLAMARADARDRSAPLLAPLAATAR